MAARKGCRHVARRNNGVSPPPKMPGSLRCFGGEGDFNDSYGLLVVTGITDRPGTQE